MNPKDIHDAARFVHRDYRPTDPENPWPRRSAFSPIGVLLMISGAALLQSSGASLWFLTAGGASIVLGSILAWRHYKAYRAFQEIVDDDDDLRKLYSSPRRRD